MAPFRGLGSCYERTESVLPAMSRLSRCSTCALPCGAASTSNIWLGSTPACCPAAVVLGAAADDKLAAKLAISRSSAAAEAAYHIAATPFKVPPRTSRSA